MITQRDAAIALTTALHELWNEPGKTSDIELVRLEISPRELPGIFGHSPKTCDRLVRDARSLLFDVRFPLGSEKLRTLRRIPVLVEADYRFRKGWYFIMHVYALRRLPDVLRFLRSEKFANGLRDIEP